MLRFLSIIFFFFYYQFVTQAQMPTDSLIGYWPFNNNANDESGFGNHGIVNGAVLTKDRFGNPNSAYKFDGIDDFINSDFNFNGDKTSFSVSYWIRLDQSYDYSKAKIFHLQESLITYEISNDFLSDKRLNFFLSGNNNNSNGTNLSKDTIEKDAWYHIITTFDFTNNAKSIYINGVLDTTVISLNYMDRLPYSTLRIGARIINSSGASLEYFNGVIDDFRIYKKKLTPNEVNYLYNECDYKLVSNAGIVNKYSPVNNIGCNSITIDNPQLFSTGDRVLIIQMQGAKADTSYSPSFGTILDYASAGNYEFNTVKGISGSNVTLEFTLKKIYDVNGRVQLIYVPVYNDYNICERITGKPWDGKTGGVIVIEASGNITMNADIDASGIGFRGGTVKQNVLSSDRCQPSIHYGSFLDNRGGQKGEGIAEWDSLRILNKGAWTNGGGGGNDHNSGGGGGANGGKGGRGGKLYYEPNDQPNCQGGHGQPGNSLSPSDTKLFMGGGGGAGHDNDLVGSSGGTGGGIIIIKASNIFGKNFSINANGKSSLPAQYDGAGGGGAGGTLAISAQNISNCKLIANGGNGGDNTWTYANQCVGTGGGGGGGLVLYSGNLNNTNISVSNGIAGKLSHAVIPGPCTNVNFEAESGQPGRSQSDLILAYSDQIVSNSDTVYQEICQGDEYTFPDGSTATSAGVYSVTINSSTGCDYIVITNLTVSQVANTSVNAQICQGQTFTLPNGTTVSANGSYPVTLQSSAGCDSIVTTNLTVVTVLSTSVDAQICQGQTFTLPDGSTVSANGSYPVTLPSSAGCDSVVTTILTVAPTYSETITEEICAGEEYTLPDGSTVTESGVYPVVFNTSNGCDSTIITDLKVNPLPDSIQINATTFCQGDSLVVSVQLNPGEVIIWPDGSDGNTYIFNETGTYPVIVTNACGSTTTNVSVVAEDCRTCEVFLPNAFTPNADGVNDRFTPILKCEEVSPYLFRVYNRWGELVFETTTPGVGWDGIYEGKQQPTDSYIYIVHYFNQLLGKEIIKKGVVTKLN